MAVRHAILGLLSQRARHGYELHAAFTALAGADAADVKPAQVYSTLSRLADAGLVTESGESQDGGPKRRSYALTADGKKALSDWFSMPVKTGKKRDEFFVKFMLAVGAPDTELARRVLYTQRRALYQDLHTLNSLRRTTDPTRALAQILRLDQAVMHVEADLRWLEIVETRLDEIRAQPLPEPVPKRRGRPKKTAPEPTAG